MSTGLKTTTDHHEIREWAESRGGQPSMVKGAGKDGVVILRIAFPNNEEEETAEILEDISWDEFFEQFERQKLALISQEKTEDGNLSRFNKLVGREGAGDL